LSADTFFSYAAELLARRERLEKIAGHPPYAFDWLLLRLQKSLERLASIISNPQECKMTTVSESSTRSPPYESSVRDEHAELVAKIEMVGNAIGKTPTDFDNLVKSIESLLKSTRYHFQHEEDIMFARGYAGLNKHRNDHDYLIRGLEDFLTRLVDKAITAPPELSDNLKGWLEFHIRKYDDAYLEFAETQKEKTTSLG
jgi:hemerythrin-like metal-binding protein